MSKSEKNIIKGRLVRSYLLSLFTISLILFLMGAVLLLGVNGKAVSDYFKESVVVSLILKNSVQEGEAMQLIKKIEMRDGVKSVDYISKEQGQKEMEKILGSDFLDVFQANPIPISLDIKLKGEYVVSDSLAMISEEFSKEKLVEEVVYQDSLVETLNANLSKIGVVFAVVIAILLLISSVLISNTVRLNVYDKRFVVNTMRLVGATKSFIRKPFITKGFFQGLIASLLAVVALLVTLYFAQKEFGQLFAIFDANLMLIVMSVLILVGILICVVSTAISVNKIVSLNKDELYY